MNTGARSSRTIASVIAAVLAVVGAGVIVVALVRHQSPPPQPSVAAAGSITSPSSAPKTRTQSKAKRSTSTTLPTPPTLGFSPPVEVSIPKIGVDSELVKLDRNADGTVEVPTSFHVAGWYDHSVTPGQAGPTVILGHVDSTAGPGIFYRLGSLQPGDKVSVTRTDGKVATYVITCVREYGKTSFPTIDVYGNTPGPTIRLITCGGAFDQATHHYLSNIVAFGQLA
jgi:sortase (surface protein transpeptidase)